MTKKKEVKLEAPTEVEQELIPFDPNQIVEFNPLEAQMAELRESNSKAVFDYADRKGNKEARSHINTIRLTKGVVERTRVAAKEKALEYGRAVDARAKEIVAELDGMIEVHAKPLQEIEQKEKARVERHEASIRSLSNYCTFAHTTTAEVWAVELKRVELFSVDDSLEEFLLQAAIAKRQALTEIKARLQARQTYEAEQEELRCLRVAAEKQKQIDREREIREEAAAEATRQAEAKATREKEQREREERNRIAAEEQRERDRQAAETKRLADEKAERERLQKEKEDAEQRARDAEKKAAQDLLKQQQAEAEEQRKREANKKHRAKINNEALIALQKAMLEFTGHESNDMARAVVEAIAKGKIPHVRIEY